MEREKLGSRLGFILISAGCAIGIGNVWKFPYVAGQNGGGFFVLLYLAFLVIMGIPVLSMEFSMGRRAQSSPVRMYHRIAPDKKPWRAHGYVALAGNVLLMMFYTSVSGWMIQYFFYMVSGKFSQVGAEQQGEYVENVFSGMLSSPWILMLFVAAVVAVGFIVCSFNMQKGLEKVTKIMMIALLVLIIVLAIHSLTLDGAGAGLEFYLKPNLESIKKIGVFKVVVAAMNQAFFTLSLGIGAMAIFGSFIDKKRTLLGESVTVAGLDTFVAIMSGLIIFPACSTYNIEVDAGPNLIFLTLPRVFMNMKLGGLWGSLFFLFMTFAAMSTVFAVFQNIISCLEEITGWSKKKVCILGGVGMFILSIPCILGFNVLAGMKPIGELSGILDIEDYVVSNIILPLGSLAVVIFCTHKFGWGFDNYMDEANQGKGFKVKKWMRIYMSYILPVIIGVIAVISIIAPFTKKI